MFQVSERHWFVRLLTEPTVRNLDPNSPELIFEHSQLMLNKPLLRHAFSYFYCRFAEIQLLESSSGNPKILEIGSGVGFIKEIIPAAITSDIRPIPGIDRILDAERLEIQSDSITAILAINVYHHLENRDRFLAEAKRVLKPRGVLVLVEPADTPFSRFVHSRIHKDEIYDVNLNPKESAHDGPMKGANQAQIHIDFRGKLAEWTKDDFQASKRFWAHNGGSYLLSGGLNFRPLLGPKFFWLARSLDGLFRLFPKLLSLHEFFVFVKTPNIEVGAEH